MACPPKHETGASFSAAIARSCWTPSQKKIGSACLWESVPAFPTMRVTTPLSRAARRVHEAVVRLWLGTGKVDVDAKDIMGWTLLSRAAGARYEAVVRPLLGAARVHVNSNGDLSRTSLSHAAEGGYETIVRLLLGGKASTCQLPHASTSHLHRPVNKLALGEAGCSLDRARYLAIHRVRLRPCRRGRTATRWPWLLGRPGTCPASRTTG